MSWLISKALYESLPSLPAQEAESLAEAFSAGAQSVQLSETDTPPQFWLRDKMIKVSRLSQFGMTFLPSTGTLGEDLLTSFRAAFPARIFPLQEMAQASQGPNQAFGKNSGELLARLDLSTSSWKTPQLSLLEDSALFLETWPRWGMMLNGECWERKTPSGLVAIRALITSESASGSLHGTETAPTPTVSGNYNRKGASATSGDGLHTWVSQRMQTPVADDAVNRAEGKINSRGEPKLSAQVKRMPTPRSMDSKGGNGPQSRDPSLANMIKRAPTPVASASASASKGTSLNALTRKTGKSREMDRLDHFVLAQTIRMPTPNASDGEKWSNQTVEERLQKGQQVRLPHKLGVGGQLSPMWTEWLMGWPIGQTGLEPLEMGKFHKWLLLHGIFSQAHLIKDRIRERTMPWTTNLRNLPIKSCIVGK